MAAAGDELFIGTGFGCLIVLEGQSLRPITVFRPYEEEIKAILPIVYDNNSEENENSQFNKSKRNLIITVGRGYRSLISRYINLSKEKCNLITEKGLQAIIWTTNDWII